MEEFNNLTIEDYNDEPVYYCKTCLSLKIKIVGGYDFSVLSLPIKFGKEAVDLKYGLFVQSTVAFLLTAFCIFVMVNILNIFMILGISRMEHIIIINISLESLSKLLVLYDRFVLISSVSFILVFVSVFW